MSGTTKGLNRQQMADRLALEFQDGWIVNLGVGIPTMCSQHRHRRPRHHSTTRRTASSATARSLPAGEEDLQPGQCRRAECHAEAGRGRRAPCRLVRHHPQRAYRRDGDGCLRGGAQRRLRQLEDRRRQGRRHRRRDGPRGLREARLHHPGADDTQRRAAAGGAMRAAGDGARRGDAGGDELRVVRADRRWLPDQGDRAWRHARRGARDGRLQADRAREPADGSAGA